MKIQKIKLTDLKPAEYNPRQSTKEQEEHLQASLKKFGVVEPIIINQNKERFNIVVGGHFRLRELKKLNHEDVDCVIVDLPLEDEKELNIRLNSNNGEWNLDLLANNFEIPDLENWGLDLDWGLDEEEPEIEEDEVPELKEESIVKKGDVWLLGDHRLCCGDSTILSDIEDLMDGEKADMMFTDPPYGMSLDADYSKMNNSGKKWDNVIGDDKDYDPSFLMEYFKYCKEQFWWGADYYIERIPNRNQGNLFLWDKRLKSNNDGGKSSEFEICWMKQKHTREIFDFNWFRYFGLSSQDSNKRQHPTQKPLELIKYLFKHGKENDLVTDFYGGSGSTLIACEQTNRKCFMMELDEHYCQVIIDRYINLKKNNGEDVYLLKDGKKINYKEVVNG